jgi:hypothetical protein
MIADEVWESESDLAAINGPRTGPVTLDQTTVSQ